MLNFQNFKICSYSAYFYKNGYRICTYNIQMRNNDEDLGLTTPKTYFDLIQKVGSKGHYQRNIFLIFYLNWFIGGIILMGTSFLFMNRHFQCQSHGIKVDNCQQYVCQNIPQDEWQKYLEKPLVKSLASGGNYYCDRAFRLSEFKMAPYIGVFLGYFVFLFISDNYGRKFSAVLAWSFTTLGVIIVALSWNIEIAVIGLFLGGAGCQSAIRITMMILGEQVQYHTRQSYSILLELSFGMAGVTLAGIYWLFYDWRMIFIIFVSIPAVVQLALLIYYVQQTPVFLIKKGKSVALKALNRIGRINKGEDNIVTEEDIQSVIKNQCQQNEQFGKLVMTPLDLCRYPSLRLRTFLCCWIFFFITFLYFGPIIIVDRLGINPFISQAVLSSSQLIAYPIAYFLIAKSKRRLNGIIFFGLSALLSGILIFIRQPQDCNWCTQGIVQLILVFLMRFCISYYFAILFLYITELYPLRIRGLGFGMASASGALAPTFGQPFLEFLEQRAINPMIAFTIFAALAMISVSYLEQTYNKPLKDEIYELQAKKQANKQQKAKSQYENRKKDQVQQQEIKQNQDEPDSNKKIEQDKEFPPFELQ